MLYLLKNYGVSTTLATFVGSVYDKLFSDDAKAQQAQLNELLTAINAYVAKQKAQIMKTMQLLSNRLLTHRKLLLLSICRKGLPHWMKV